MYIKNKGMKGNQQRNHEQEVILNCGIAFYWNPVEQKSGVKVWLDFSW